jgi:glycosyltransferase involved in cell wall biosynthesis
MKQIFINTRALQAEFTGVQRYISELLYRFGSKMQALAPWGKLDGIQGHLWEQSILPMMVGNQILWSPANTGPLATHRQVVTIHDIAPLDYPEWFTPKFALWYGWLLPRLARRVLKIIVPTEFTKERILERMRIASDKIVVIPQGVPNHFCPQPVEMIAKVRKALRIPGSVYILSVASLEPRKNLHRLLLAWKNIVYSLPAEIWLVLAGAKGNRKVFQNLSLDDLPPRVYLTGHVPDEYLPALYSGGLALFYLSVYEGFGMPPLEAMSCGIPAVVGNCPALREAVGNAGLLVSPYDIEAIEWSIKKMIGDSVVREELKYRGLERSKNFTWDHAALRTWEVLQAIASHE